MVDMSGGKNSVPETFESKRSRTKCCRRNTVGGRLLEECCRTSAVGRVLFEQFAKVITDLKTQKKVMCSFLVNLAGRPGICSNRNLIRNNPKTLG